MKIFFLKEGRWYDVGGGGAKLTFSFHFRSVFDKSHLTVCLWVSIVNKRTWGNRETRTITHKVHIITTGSIKRH